MLIFFIIYFIRNHQPESGRRNTLISGILGTNDGYSTFYLRVKVIKLFPHIHSYWNSIWNKKSEDSNRKNEVIVIDDDNDNLPPPPPQKKKKYASSSNVASSSSSNVVSSHSLEKVSCSICYEDVEKRSVISCKSGKSHFCASCIKEHFKSLRSDTTGIDDKLRYSSTNGFQMKCLSPGCSEYFNEQDTIWKFSFLLQKDQNLFALLQAEADKCKRLLWEKETLSTVNINNSNNNFDNDDNDDDSSSIVKTLSKKALDRLLLRCPNKRCSAVFLDFEGCCCVKCSRCNNNFCAFCLRYYNLDSPTAHTHVASCSENPTRTYYVSDIVIRCIGVNLRIDQLRSLFLEDANDRFYFEVITNISSELNDIGIGIKEDGGLTVMNPYLPKTVPFESHNQFIPTATYADIKSIHTSYKTYEKMSLTYPYRPQKKSKKQQAVVNVPIADDLDDNDDVQDEDFDPEVPNEPRRRRRRANRRLRLCGWCNQRGLHDYRNCPLRLNNPVVNNNL